MKITIVAVGKLKEKYWKEALAEYLRRLSAFAKIEVIEVPDLGSQFGSEQQIKAAEGESILKRLAALQSSDCQVICLDNAGKPKSSEQLSAHFDQLKLCGKSRFVFIIGGSHGLAPSVLAKADESLSLGPQTWPHNMVRVMLLEQIYRAKSISVGHPYHK